METHPPRPATVDAAREQLTTARRAHDASLRRAVPPVRLIIAVSIFSGVLTIAPSHRGPGGVLTIVALIWVVAELLLLSAHNHWRALRSLPRPRWNAGEYALLVAAVLIGALVGPHLLAGRGNSAAVSWGLGAGVAVAVASCLLAANASYRHRSSRAWRR